MEAPTRIRGSVLKARLAFVEQIGGRGALEKVLAALPEGDRVQLSGFVSSTGWFPLNMGARLDEAIVRALGKGDPKYFERLGEASAEKNLGGPHREFLVAGDPQAFMAKASVIYSFYYQGGSRSYEPTSPTGGVMVTRDAPHFSAPDCLTVVGWYRKALQMCGAHSVRVTEEECRAKGGRVCLYRVAWT